MGQNIESKDSGHEGLRAFTRQILRDLSALNLMIEGGMIESGVERIGAEQELCLIDKNWNAAPLAMEILEHISDPHVVNEFARFNLEINLDPQPFSGDCFARMERQLEELLALTRAEARRFETDICLAGILPTLKQRDLVYANMTPLPRYKRLNENLKKMRAGKPFEFNISGADELSTSHPSALLEGCNTSFQVHLQVSPETFVDQYNFAQLITAPLLAASTNSPLLFFRRLWKETRICLFQQSIDTRQVSQSVREQSPRVTFGKDWVRNSVSEIFEDDLSRYRMVIHSDPEEDSLAMLASGKTPLLKALRLFNGTVYRWNRACYGISEGKPHLRIENRVLPAGPTVIDEMANSAFWLGMMKGMPDHYRDLPQKMSFDLAYFNFIKSAKMGLDTEFIWLDDRVVAARDLILEELLPIARDGLEAAGVHQQDRDRLLDVIEARVSLRHTGSMWIFESFNKLIRDCSRPEAASLITAAMVHNQKTGAPVHLWPLPERGEIEMWPQKFFRVEQIMSTDLYTVGQHDLVDLARHIMDWKRIRHVPVEDERGQLIGLVSARSLLRFFSNEANKHSAAVSEVMIQNPITVTPATPTLEALQTMKEKKVSCLPVVEDGALVGVVTEYDFTRVSAELLTWLSLENQNKPRA